MVNHTTILTQFSYDLVRYRGQIFLSESTYCLRQRPGSLSIQSKFYVQTTWRSHDNIIDAKWIDQLSSDFPVCEIYLDTDIGDTDKIVWVSGVRLPRTISTPWGRLLSSWDPYSITISYYIILYFYIIIIIYCIFVFFILFFCIFLFIFVFYYILLSYYIVLYYIFLCFIVFCCIVFVLALQDAGVYKHACEYSFSYIGQTEQSISTCVKEYIVDVKNLCMKKSAVCHG